MSSEPPASIGLSNAPAASSDPAAPVVYSVSPLVTNPGVDLSTDVGLSPLGAVFYEGQSFTTPMANSTMETGKKRSRKEMNDIPRKKLCKRGEGWAVVEDEEDNDPVVMDGSFFLGCLPWQHNRGLTEFKVCPNQKGASQLA